MSLAGKGGMNEGCLTTHIHSWTSAMTSRTLSLVSVAPSIPGLLRFCSLSIPLTMTNYYATFMVSLARREKTKSYLNGQETWNKGSMVWGAFSLNHPCGFTNQEASKLVLCSAMMQAHLEALRGWKSFSYQINKWLLLV